MIKLAWHGFCILKTASENRFLLKFWGEHWSSSCWQVLSWVILLRHTSLQPSMMDSIFKAKSSSPPFIIRNTVHKHPKICYIAPINDRCKDRLSKIWEPGILSLQEWNFITSIFLLFWSKLHLYWDFIQLYHIKGENFSMIWLLIPNRS